MIVGGELLETLKGRTPLSRLLSLPWGWLTDARTKAYAEGRLKSGGVSVPVLCVGNISVGGSGKSPLVMHLARELSAARPLPWLDASFAGRRTAILSRGYGRKSRGFVMVSEGEGPLVDARLSGDEPALFARSLPGVTIAVCENRLHGARQLQERGIELILLDDGFQHFRLQRDLDILVWDCRIDPARESLLPFGRLREKPAAASRAGILVLNHCASTRRALLRLNWFRRYTQAPALAMRTRHTGLRDPQTGLGERAPGGRYGLFSGLGNPRAFEAELSMEYGLPAWSRRFRDHHWFGSRDLEELRQAVHRQRLDSLVCTWKDVVRLPEGHGLPILVAEQEVELVEL